MRTAGLDQNVSTDRTSVIGIPATCGFRLQAEELIAMANSSEVEALKASFRGALSTAAALQSLQSQVESLDASGEIGAEVLEELARVTAAHAIASAALRGLVETMIARR